MSMTYWSDWLTGDRTFFHLLCWGPSLHAQWHWRTLCSHHNLPMEKNPLRISIPSITDRGIHSLTNTCTNKHNAIPALNNKKPKLLWSQICHHCTILEWYHMKAPKSNSKRYFRMAFSDRIPNPITQTRVMDIYRIPWARDTLSNSVQEDGAKGWRDSIATDTQLPRGTRALPPLLTKLERINSMLPIVIKIDRYIWFCFSHNNVGGFFLYFFPLSEEDILREELREAGNSIWGPRKAERKAKVRGECLFYYQGYSMVHKLM